jgi:hypothetical protein
MNNPFKTSKLTGHKKAIIILASLMLASGLVAVYVANLFQNRAAEVLKPIGKELVNSGATLMCGSGDPGRGPDNNAAYYRAYYDLRLNKGDAVALVEKIAKDQGYSLTHASPNNRGHLGAVADAYIDKWYFDNTSKQNTQADIRPGSIELAVVVDGVGDKRGCAPEKRVENGHTELGIEVRLPAYY